MPVPPAAPRLRLHTAIALVVANMVGTGVFTSLGFQVAALSDPFALLMLWVIGGLVALAGALSYGELATALPRSGGEYHFLGSIYHPGVGFVAGWISATLGFAAPTALAAMAFAQYLRTIWPALPANHLAAGAVLAITLVHLRAPRAGGWLHNGFTLAKVLLCLALPLAAAWAWWQLPGPWPPIQFWPTGQSWAALTSPAFAVSLIYVSYAYTGWNAAAYLTGEVDNAPRNLPRALIVGTALVAGLYGLLNHSFLLTVPQSQLAGQLEVGYLAARRIFGPAGGQVMAGVIALLLVSTMSAMIFVGPRITQRMGQDFARLAWLVRQNPRGVPTAAMLLQLGVTLLFIYTSTFEAALTYAACALILITILAVAGVLVLRARQPQLPRPYRVLGYPVVPLLFLALNGWTLYYTATERPLEAAVSLGIVLLGAGVYWLVK